jgi:hypothetical protein
MSATSASAPSTTAHVATNSRLRRLAHPAPGSTVQLATTHVGGLLNLDARPK